MSDTATNTAAPDTALINKIVRQVEYYFSDSNFPNDKFLKGEAAKNPEGYVNIDIIAAFNRMKTLTTDLQLITDSLKNSERLIVSEDGKMVRRTDPLPDNEEHSKKTLYSKGWPQDTTTIEIVEEFFGKYGKVFSVRLRKNKEKSFKGSLLVDLDSEETVNKIIAEAPKFGEIELIYQTYKQFADEKKEQDAHFLSKKEKKNKRKDTEGGRDDVKEEDIKVPGTILRFKAIGEGADRGMIKAVFSQYGEVVHIDYSAPNDHGLCRYKTSESAKRALEAVVAEKKEVAGKVPELSILEGDEEEEEWKKIFEFKKKGNKKGGFKKGGFKKGGFKQNKKQKN